MKKNVLTENRIKGTKGFYVALGISAVMIGSACLFAYNQGEQLADTQLSAELSTPAVDKKYDNVPKPVTTMSAYVVNVTPVTTAPQIPVETMPVEEIIIETPEEEFQEVIAEEDESAEEAVAEEDAVETGAVRLENVKPPLADISDVINIFSGTDLVKNETTGSWQTHNGTDLGAETGSEVYAISNGEVMSVKKDALWGVTVVLDHHNGYVTKYCNLAEDLSVQEGDTLVSGDIIGLVGQTADIESSLAPHLHIEITHNGSFIDPMSVMQ
ncbi:MAG: M23 family metallopeptidase [Ruminococcus sp.]|nr:M23 family metallopeptidase [Ruminococcus sp.]